MDIVTSLGDGELTLPAPFDLATSAALASNIDDGWLAQKLFEVTAGRDCGYEVAIFACTPHGGEPMRREVVNTTVNSTQLLLTLLEGLIDELDARLEAGHNAD